MKAWVIFTLLSSFAEKPNIPQAPITVGAWMERHNINPKTTTVFLGDKKLEIDEIMPASPEIKVIKARS